MWRRPIKTKNTRLYTTLCGSDRRAGDGAPAPPRGDRGLASAGDDGPDPGRAGRDGDVRDEVPSMASSARASPTPTTAARKRGGPASRLTMMTEA